MPDDATPAPHRTRALTPADVFRFRHATEPQIAPDARRLCFIEVSRDVMTDRRCERLMLSEAGGAWRAVAESDGVAVPRWAPDGRRLAFLRRTASGHAVVVLDTADGSRRVIAEDAVRLRELAWSPDGRRLAWQRMVAAPPPAWLDMPAAPEGATWSAPPRVTERWVYRHDQEGELVEGAFQLMVCALDGGAPRQVTAGPWSSGFMHGPGLVWSADGLSVILSASRRPDWDRAPNALDLHAIAVADGAATRLTDLPGTAAMPAVAPDGRIAFTGVTHAGVSAARRRLFVIPAGGGAPRELLPELDRSIDGVAWRGGHLVVSFDDEGGKVLARVGTDGTLTRLARDVGGGNIEMPYSSGTFSVAADGTVAYTRGTVDVPSEVAVIRPDGAAETVTDLNGALAAELGGFAGATVVHARSRRDGLPIEGWLLRPRDAAPGARLPMILEIHGGPFACYGERFSIKHQCFAAAGYAVLFVNPRGSIGYGEAFAQALHDAHPGPDWDDLMDAVDAAILGGGIDPERLHVTGTSGGGVLTLWSVTHTERFRSAVSLKPVVSQESWMLTADIGLYLGDLWFGGVRPWQDQAKFRDRSPLAFVERVRTPTMLIGGDRDSRTPISEAHQMYAALQLLGVPTALVSLPEAAHSTATMRPSAFAGEIAATLSWFRRYS